MSNTAMKAISNMVFMYTTANFYLIGKQLMLLPYYRQVRDNPNSDRAITKISAGTFLWTIIEGNVKGAAKSLLLRAQPIKPKMVAATGLAMVIAIGLAISGAKDILALERNEACLASRIANRDQHDNITTALNKLDRKVEKLNIAAQNEAFDPNTSQQYKEVYLQLQATNKVAKGKFKFSLDRTTKTHSSEVNYNKYSILPAIVEQKPSIYRSESLAYRFDSCLRQINNLQRYIKTFF